MVEMETPSQTLYINNLADKLSPGHLKKNLYLVFSEFGKVIHIVANRSAKLRGQAWVSFDDPASAANALQSKQGFDLCGKPMKISFSKTVTKIIKQEEFATDKERSNVNKRSWSGMSEGQVDTENMHQRFDIDDTDAKIIVVCVEGAGLAQHTEALKGLFSQYTGPDRVRLVEGKDVCFVDFVETESAQLCVNQLGGYAISSDCTLKLTLM
jgi:U2 small nuclear ribonucleoprotein B''